MCRFVAILKGVNKSCAFPFKYTLRYSNIKKVALNLYQVKSKLKQDVVYTVDMTIGRCPAGNCMFKVNKRNTKTRCEICSKLTIKTPERHYSVSIVNFEQVNADWMSMFCWKKRLYMLASRLLMI